MKNEPFYQDILFSTEYCSTRFFVDNGMEVNSIFGIIIIRGYFLKFQQIFL